MIKLLPQDLINKIAAGEVVERPASVVKELTENAVDAAATRIEVVLEEGGIKLIKVVDDGKGMNESDAKLCLTRHATSKIETAEDLFNIHTLGFRGEALASIAAVSQFELVTKQAGLSQGLKVTLDQSHQPQLEPTAANDGTTVTIKNLFYNVPARQKFLKTSGTEFSHILRYLQQFALVHPEIELKVQHSKKEIFHYHPSSWEERVQKVLGKEFSSKLIPIREEQSTVPIKGFIAKPELVHATHKNQYLFVNGRPVYDHLINRSVLEGYGTMVPRGYFPAFVIKIDIDPEMIDVNVHPRKSEVKFRSPSLVIKFIKDIVNKSLNKADLTSSQQLSNITADLPKTAFPQRTSHSSTSSSSVRPSPHMVKQALEFSSSFAGSIRELKQTALAERGWRVLGQIHLSFILVETKEGLQLMDQHAISEITNYHRLKQEHENGEICSQQLLLPAQVEVTAEEKALLEEHRELFSRLGWEIDELSKNSLQISALPEILKLEKISENFHDLMSQLKESKNIDMTERELAILKFEACRGAVMFGDLLSQHEMEGLINQWLQIPNNAACEHGRPAAARISVEEMRKYFKR